MLWAKGTLGGQTWPHGHPPLPSCPTHTASSPAHLCQGALLALICPRGERGRALCSRTGLGPRATAQHSGAGRAGDTPPKPTQPLIQWWASLQGGHLGCTGPPSLPYRAAHAPGGQEEAPMRTSTGLGRQRPFGTGASPLLAAHEESPSTVGGAKLCGCVLGARGLGRSFYCTFVTHKSSWRHRGGGSLGGIRYLSPARKSGPTGLVLPSGRAAAPGFPPRQTGRGEAEAGPRDSGSGRLRSGPVPPCTGPETTPRSPSLHPVSPCVRQGATESVCVEQAVGAQCGPTHSELLPRPGHSEREGGQGPPALDYSSAGWDGGIIPQALGPHHPCWPNLGPPPQDRPVSTPGHTLFCPPHTCPCQVSIFQGQCHPHPPARPLHTTTRGTQKNCAGPCPLAGHTLLCPLAGKRNEVWAEARGRDSSPACDLEKRLNPLGLSFPTSMARVGMKELHALHETNLPVRRGTVHTSPAGGSALRGQGLHTDPAARGRESAGARAPLRFWFLNKDLRLSRHHK